MQKATSNNHKLTEHMILNKNRANSIRNIKHLNFWGHDLNDVSIIEEMPNLEVVSLSMNNISSLKPFSNLPNLKELYLRNNSISDIREIHWLEKLPNLSILWLAENPICEDKEYKKKILAKLPQVDYLDTKPGEKTSDCKKTQETISSLPSGSPSSKQDAILTAILALIPALKPESIQIVLEEIMIKSQC